jgi:hypothetical protein
MRYTNEFSSLSFSGKELKKASKILKEAYPDGPQTQSTEKVSGSFTFNEIANHIHNSYQQVSKSLHG